MAGEWDLTAVGCFTISIVSFILPPLLHMRLLPNESKASWYVDLLFVILGVGVMAVATTTTVLTMKWGVCLLRFVDGLHGVFSSLMSLVLACKDNHSS